MFHVLYPCCYHLSAVKKIKPDKVIFVETHEDHVTDNYALLYEALKKREYELHVHYLKVAASNWRQIIVRSLKLIWDMGDAGYIFLNESNSLFGSFLLRRGSKLIQVWHACGAFKKWGFSAAEKTFGEDKRTLERYSGHRNYSLMTVSGSEVVWAYEEAFGLPKNGGIVKPLGVSRTDVFFDQSKCHAAREKMKSLPIYKAGRKLLVYLPTFRGNISEAKAPTDFDMEKLSELSDAYMVVIKNHPFVKEPYFIPESCKDFCMEIHSEMTVEDLLMAADVCITDYSSVVFEYSLFQKPIIFYAYDIDAYDLERGFYYPYKEFVPGPIVYSMDELTHALTHLDAYDYQKLQHFRDKFMDGCDGHATERILNYVGIV